MRRILFVVALSLLGPAVLIKSRGSFPFPASISSNDAEEGTRPRGSSGGALNVAQKPSFGHSLVTATGFDNGLGLSFAQNARPNEPNLYVDITRYGARAVTTLPSTTATCSSGSAMVSLASASSFQNGDGIRIDGCGAANNMRVPDAPIVTPKIASGLIGTAETVNSLNGSAKYNYQCVAADKEGGYTAASAAGSTNVGLASLGDSGPMSISSISRSGNVVTVNMNSATNIVVGTSVWIQGVSDGTFNGAFKVASAPSRNKFTYVSGVTTANGGSTSATGGTVDYYAANQVACSALSGRAWKYYIYLNGSLIGQTKPLENIYDDWGATLRGTPSFPAYIPMRAPTSGTNDPLVTTIVSGAGTMTLTLANVASNSATSTRAVFDNAPAISAAISAAGGSPVLIPNVSSGQFVVNSFLNLGGATIWHAGPVSANETVQVGSGINYIGYLGGAGKNGPAGDLDSEPTFNVGTAHPGLYIFGNGTLIDGVTFLSGSDQALDVLDDGGGTFGGSYNHLNFITGNASTNEDYLGIGYEVRGKFGIKFENTTITPNMSNSGPTGLWAPEIFVRGAPTCCSVGTQITMETTSAYSKGFAVEHTWGNSTIAFFIDWWYSQGPRSPMFVINSAPGINVGGQVSIRNTIIDTSFAPTLSNFAPGLTPPVLLENVSGPSGSQLNVTGNPLNLYVFNSALNGVNTGVTAPPAFSDENVNVVGYGTFTYNFALPPPAPELTLAAGGSMPVGIHTFAVRWYDINGHIGQLGPASSISVTSGNQTVQISLPSFPQGVVQYGVLQDGNSLAVHDGNQCGPLKPTQTWNANVGFTCGAAPSPSSASGPSSISSKGISTPILNLINNGFTATPSFPNRLTANRSIIIADGSGAPVVSGSLTTTSATSDKVAIEGVTSSSHCWPAATNASAAANISLVYISAVEKNQVTVTHKAISGMTFTIACTPN